MTKVQVIGESCQDFFVYCDASRLAPDLPVPVLNEIYTIKNPGMASNVYCNIVNYNPSTSLITNPNWQSIAKTRYVHNATNHTFFRVDKEVDIAPLNIDQVDFGSDIIVISDYNKGFLSSELVEEICNLHQLVFLDTKKVLGTWAEKAKYIKINNYEFEHSKEYLTPNLRNKIIHTAGPKGSYFQGQNFGVEKIDVRDSSGAGDTFLAALVLEYSISGDIEKSIKSANVAASGVVQSRGVVTF